MVNKPLKSQIAGVENRGMSEDLERVVEIDIGNWNNGSSGAVLDREIMPDCIPLRHLLIFIKKKKIL